MGVNIRPRNRYNLAMNALTKALRGSKCLLFMDLEGTQFSSDIIETGATKVVLRPDGTPKKAFKPFQTYVKTKARVGYRVTKMTGITDKMLEEQGVDFASAIKSLKKYVGSKYWGSCLFVVFGNYDQKMIKDTDSHHKDCDHEIIRHILSRLWDIQTFLQAYVQDTNGNPLSLENYIKAFELEFEGTPHKATWDAYNLYKIYEAFINRPDIVEREYKKVVSHGRRMPYPAREVMVRLSEGKTVSPEDLDQIIREYLK